jgi:thiol-disulfide isomerase/thioredoxin
MNKNIILGGVVVIGIIVAIVLSGSGTKKQVADTQENSNEITNVQNENTTDLNTADTAVAGNYETYSVEKLAFAETGNVVLFFRASWCPSCRTLDKDIKENLGAIPSDLKILNVDYDNSQELKQKYGVTTQHTLVQVDKDGNMINKWSGSPTLSSLVTQIK